MFNMVLCNRRRSSRDHHSSSSSSAATPYIDHNHSIQLILQLWTLRLMDSEDSHHLVERENIFALFGRSVSVELMIRTTIPILLNKKRYMLALQLLVQAFEFLRGTCSQRIGSWTIVEQLLFYEATAAMNYTKFRSMTNIDNEMYTRYIERRRLKTVVEEYVNNGESRMLLPFLRTFAGDEFVFSSALHIMPVDRDGKSMDRLTLPSDVVTYVIVPFLANRESSPKLIKQFFSPSHCDHIRITSDSIPLPYNTIDHSCIPDQIATYFFQLVANDPPRFFFKHFIGLSSSDQSNLRDGKALMFYSLKHGGDSIMPLIVNIAHHPNVSPIYRLEFFKDVHRRFASSLSHQSWQHYLDAMFYPDASNDLQMLLYGRTQEIRQLGKQRFFEQLEQQRASGISNTSIHHSCIIEAMPSSTKNQCVWKNVESMDDDSQRAPDFSSFQLRSFYNASPVRSLYMRYSTDERGHVWLLLDNPPSGRSDLNRHRKLHFDRLFASTKEIDYSHVIPLFDLTIEDARLFVESVALEEDTFLKIVKRIGQQQMCKHVTTSSTSSSTSLTSPASSPPTNETTIVDHVLLLICLGTIASSPSKNDRMKRLFDTIEMFFLYPYNFSECCLIAFSLCSLNQSIEDGQWDSFLDIMIEEIENVENLEHDSLVMVQRLLEYEHQRFLRDRFNSPSSHSHSHCSRRLTPNMTLADTIRSTNLRLYNRLASIISTST